MFGVLLVDLFKAFDYLTNRKQWTRIDFHNNFWKQFLFKVPQWWISGPLPSLYACYLCLYLCHLCLLISNKDHQLCRLYCTLHLWRKYTLDHKVTRETSDFLCQGFSDNHMKDENKRHVSLSTNENVLVNIRTARTQNSSSVKLSENKIDPKWN